MSAEHYLAALVATGSSTGVMEGLDEVDYLTSGTMELKVLATMLVLGGGYVVPEQAQLFARLGIR